MASQLTLLWRLVTTVRNWPVYFLNRFGKMEGKTEVRFHLWNGMTIIGRPFSIDRAIINEEWLDCCYDPNYFGVPWDWSACRNVVDIGSHIGTFTLYAAAHAKNARIAAVEPEPSNVEVLRKNIAVNKLENRVTVYPAAMADRDGTMTLHVTYDKSASGGHSLYDYTGTGKAVEIPTLSLQTLFTKQGIEKCEFLKIDCEGAEYAMLFSAPDELLKKVRFLALEVHHFSKEPNHTPQAMKLFLENRGFTVMSPAKSLLFAWRTA